MDKGPREVMRALLSGTPEERREALDFQWKSFRAKYHCYPNELRRPWNLKLWFNGAFPYYRLCFHRWCLRFQTYDYRCGKHQSD